MDPEKLNDDQRATLKTLPALEAVLKELKEFKKVIEVSLSAENRNINPLNAHRRLTKQSWLKSLRRSRPNLKQPKRKGWPGSFRKLRY
jgi:hypothetical protein